MKTFPQGTILVESHGIINGEHDRHPKALRVSIQPGLQTGSTESFLNRLKPVQVSISRLSEDHPGLRQRPHSSPSTGQNAQEAWLSMGVNCSCQSLNLPVD